MGFYRVPSKSILRVQIKRVISKIVLTLVIVSRFFLSLNMALCQKLLENIYIANINIPYHSILSRKFKLPA